MSCRIDLIVGGDNLIVLYISGKLTGGHVETLRNVLRQGACGLVVDRRDISIVDREAVQLLTMTEYNKTELKNCPAYVREWVTRERTDM